VEKKKKKKTEAGAKRRNERNDQQLGAISKSGLARGSPNEGKKIS